LPRAAFFGEIILGPEPGVIIAVPNTASIAPDLSPLVAYLGAALALAAFFALLRRLGARLALDRRSPARGRIPVTAWRGSAAIVTAVAAGSLLAPVLVALRQIYALPGGGGRLAALVLLLLLLVAAAMLAVLFADPGEDR
jgi:hypothetical protein